MMSGPELRKKGKNLVQTKLSFTSIGSPANGGNLPSSGADPTVGGKGTKRKMDTKNTTNKKSATDNDDRENPVSKPGQAAEKRLRQAKESSESETTSSYFPTTDRPKTGKKEEAVASTSTDNGEENKGMDTEEGRPAGDTQQYDMSGSQDLFATDSENMNDSQYSNADDEENDEDGEEDIPGFKPATFDPNGPWKGKALDKLNAAPSCLPSGLTLERSENHDVCIKMPYKTTALPLPFPSLFRDRWDGDHVRMPCSDQNEYPTDDGNLQKRWDLIKKALKSPIPGVFELEEAILTYNQRYANKWNFMALRGYFQHEMSTEDKEQFFGAVLPLMTELALKLPFICTQSIPLLKRGRNKKLTLSQQQIACLLANAFFCTFPRRNTRMRNAEYSNYPDINFNNLFQGPANSRKMEKLKCIVNYFKRVLADMPTGIVTFTRQGLQRPFDWKGNMDELTELHVSSTGTIEDNGIGMLQVDFANKYLGGGVLGQGCVQEEIRFMICPEMIVTRLFTEVLGDMESLIMTGCEQFSSYDGYADTFKFAGNVEDKTERDSLGRLCCEVVAIDAMVFRGDYGRQFKKPSLLRELNKAYCGFMTRAKQAHRSAVCTGNWGCGAFGGDKQLKSLIQLMAASAAKRDVCFFTFEDERLTAGLYNVHEMLRNEEKTVGDVLQLLEDYGNQVVRNNSRRPGVGLFDFIHQKLGCFDDQESDYQMSGDFDEDSNEATAHGKRDGGSRSPDYKARTP